jgi:hypothetical protein
MTMGMKKSRFLIQVSDEAGPVAEFELERTALHPPKLKVQY